MRHWPLALLLCCLPLVAATPEEEIRAAESAFSKAITAKDVAALDKLFTPKIIYAHATGKIETKQQYLDRLAGGKQRYDSFTAERMEIVVYGNSAVCHLTVRVKGQNDNGPFNDHVLMMHHWVKDKNAWRLASHQTAKIP
jgi:ketosteroid isomerase-like protein